MNLEGEKLVKHVDWDIGRISVGKTIMQRLFKQGEIIIISKSHDNTVIVRKKDHGERTENERKTIFNCETCKFFKEIGSYQKMSECHRNPPQFTAFDKTTNAFPRVSKANFCGEYKPKETNNPTRVYILARELNAKSSTIIEKCQKHNFDIKNNMSLVSLGQAGLIREWFSKPKQNKDF